MRVPGAGARRNGVWRGDRRVHLSVDRVPAFTRVRLLLRSSLLAPHLDAGPLDGLACIGPALLPIEQGAA